MIKQTKLLALVLSAITVSFGIVIVPPVLADDAAVTSNGAQSSNDINVSSSNQTVIQSSNNAAITNDVKTNTTTGGNTINANTGGANSIITGNATSSTDITNTANNSKVDASSCNCDTSANTSAVTGNGAGSDNAITQHDSNKTIVSVMNNATIVNNVAVRANTGSNIANNNTGGDVTIKTGDITVNNVLTSGSVNVAKVSVPAGGSVISDTLLKISGNGALSENAIDASSKNKINVDVYNFADIVNNLKLILNTGKNDSNFNTGGNVNITTGDIFAETTITNAANLTVVDVTCNCQNQQPAIPPTETNQPSAPAPSTTTSSGGGSSSSSSPGQEVAAAIVNMLPVTGNNALFFFMFANIMMLLFGAYLRLRSGNSPGLALAF